MTNRRGGDSGADAAAGRRDEDVRRELLSRVAGQVGEGVAAFDNDDRLLYANPALAALHGRSASELVGWHLRTFVDVGGAAWERSLAATAGDDSIVRVEMRTRRSDGSRLDVDVAVSSLVDDAGDRIGRIVCVHDVTVRKELQERLQRAALHDPLTDLPNRRLLSDRLAHSLAVAERTGTAVAVLFVDLDGFKQVNDDNGHDLGDRLLVETADRFRSCLRDADTLARLGGDEFVVVVEGVTDPMEPNVTAQRLLAAMASPFVLGGIDIEISASIGIALSGSGTQRSLLHAADGAMYEAKGAGPGRIVFSPSNAGPGRRRARASPAR